MPDEIKTTIALPKVAEAIDLLLHMITIINSGEKVHWEGRRARPRFAAANPIRTEHGLNSGDLRS